jgi:signal transduction histidine kinase
VLAIEDDGPGIPEESLEQVFRPFTRVEASRNRQTGGFGLGLTIARTIARGLGGEIRLENRKGGGLRTELRLPRAAEVA